MFAFDPFKSRIKLQAYHITLGVKDGPGIGNTFDDLDAADNAVVATLLAELFSYAHQWALQENRQDSYTLSSSMPPQ
jgi:hypothetical protein